MTSALGHNGPALRKTKSIRFFVTLAFLLLSGFGIWRIATCSQTVKWVGRTDLEICFVVTDAASGQPIPGATVQVRVDPGGFCDDCKVGSFTIEADRNGDARQVCTNCMCFGSRGCFENSYVVHLPCWWVSGKATGYQMSEPDYIDVPENIRQTRRGKPFATVVIPVRLHKE